VAEPNKNYYFYPKVVYYVATGEYKQGQVVNVQIATMGFPVDFSALGTPRNVILVHDGNGKFSFKK
jgi:hypothetical protein